jgi:hypothetical protein
VLTPGPRLPCGSEAVSLHWSLPLQKMLTLPSTQIHVHTKKRFSCMSKISYTGALCKGQRAKGILFLNPKQPKFKSQKLKIQNYQNPKLPKSKITKITKIQNSKPYTRNFKPQT